MYIKISQNNNSSSSNQDSNDENSQNILLRELLGYTRNSRIDIDKIKQALTDFTFQERQIQVNEEFNVLNFWHQLRNSSNYHEISKLCKIVQADPFSQVPVERTFSVFALTLTHLITCIGDDLLNAIILTRDNVDLLDKLQFI